MTAGAPIDTRTCKLLSIISAWVLGYYGLVSLNVLSFIVRLSESRPTISESTSQSNGSKSSSSHYSHAGDGDDYDKLLTRVLSASTASTLTDIVLHLRDTFVRVYSKCEGRQIKEKYCTFQLEWHKHCSAFLLEKSSYGHNRAP